MYCILHWCIIYTLVNHVLCIALARICIRVVHFYIFLRLGVR